MNREENTAVHSLRKNPLLGSGTGKSELQTEIARLKRLLMLTPSVIYTTDVQNNNTCTFVSDNLTEILGHKPKQMMDSSSFWYEHLHPDDRERAVRQSQIGLKRGSGKIEYRFRHEDGSYRRVEDRFRVIFDNSGNPAEVIGSWTDITERQETEEALRFSNVELEQRKKEIEILAELNDHLYVCHNISETKEVILHFLPRLFPETCGVVFVFNQSRSMLEMIANWGEANGSMAVFVQEDCWSLRQGKIHFARDTSTDLICNHIEERERISAYQCLPLIAQADVLGLLYIADVVPGNNGVRDHRLNGTQLLLASSTSKQLALSLMNLRLRQSLKTQATRDPLTQLYNRRFMVEFMEREFIKAKRSKANIGVMMLDFDHFKQFNDIYGHGAGDAVLREVAAFIRGCVRESDIACRYGGEEFALVLPEADPEKVRERAEMIRDGVKKLRVNHKDTQLGTISLSIGMANLCEHHGQPEELIAIADAALYRAKLEGRDKVVVAEATQG